MSFDEDQKEMILKNIPRIHEILEELLQKGLKREDVIAVIQNRINKGITKSKKHGKPTVARFLQEFKQLELDVRGNIDVRGAIE